MSTEEQAMNTEEAVNTEPAGNTAEAVNTEPAVNTAEAVNTEEQAMSTPTIRATFELDAAGLPTAEETGDLRHYHIKLHVDGAPPDTYAVTYLLDPSYHSPVREVRDSEAAFEEHLTSYGDYTVQAKIRTRDGVTTIAVPLSTALGQSYGKAPSSAIAEALKNITTL